MNTLVLVDHDRGVLDELTLQAMTAARSLGSIDAVVMGDYPALAPNLRVAPFAEGRAAQILHVGPYSAERPTIERLHAAVAAAGLRLRGRHHEIYLGDPRRTAPERYRTLIRHPVE